ncbi:MAG: glycoside hydrolase family 104 protein [Pyrinomonadaceae bacterium]
MADVTYIKPVSDANLKVVLQRIANLLNKNIRVHSGDRQFVPTGGSRTSLHMQKRAADFHIAGTTDQEGFRQIKARFNEIFDATEAYEMVHHGPYTETEGQHLHVGHYGNGKSGYVKFKVEGLTRATSGNYNDPGSETKQMTPGGSAAPLSTPGITASATVYSPDVGIGQSVGAGGVNQPPHVTLVQLLINRGVPRLKQAGIRFEPFNSLVENGVCDNLTIRAITIFQRDVIGISKPDGKVDPGGRTIRALYIAAYKDPKTIRTPEVSMEGGAKAINIVNARDLLLKPEIKALLDTIAYSEGTRRDRGGKEYGTIVNGKITKAPFNPDWVGKRSQNFEITNFSRYPNLLVLWRESRPQDSDSYSSAVGRYQFLRKTWTWMAGYGLSDFSPGSQDVAAVMLMQYRGMVGPLLSGDLDTAIHSGSEEWASFPKKSGGGSYSGQNAHSVERLRSVYQTALQKCKG